ncbi:unnamed protein product [Penicillium manginii]
MKNKEGWDGKMRVEPKAVITNPEALEDSDYSDPEAPPVEEIDADEDLLADEDVNTEVCWLEGAPMVSKLGVVGRSLIEIDLVHCRISSLSALHLERFEKLRRLCLRQNQIQRINFPSNVAQSMKELDLYDNLISHIKGLDEFSDLASLDLSFNKIKHIKNVSHLVHLTDIYFVQNKISTIEGLEGLLKLRNLELGANRIREIENLDHLAALEELWLGKNKIVEMKNLDALQNLRIISIQSNRLTNITGVSNLPNLEELYLSHNAITDLTGLENNTALRVLDFSNNQVSHLEHLSSLKNLEELWASNNQLASFDEVERELKGKENLQTVYFEGNPLQMNGPAVYRNKVKLALPQIVQIDATYLRV